MTIPNVARRVVLAATTALALVGASRSVAAGSQRSAVPAVWQGAVVALGDAVAYHAAAGQTVASPPVAMATTPDRKGFWIVTTHGNVYDYGDARYFGSPAHGGLKVADIVAMARTADGGGYWIAASTGQVYAFGDATSFQAGNGAQLPSAVTGIAPSAGSGGYWLATASGQTYAFGDAPPLQPLRGVAFAAPVVGIAATADGGGYWLVGARGAVYPFGDATGHGSLSEAVKGTTVGIAPTPDGGGYWLVSSSGVVTALGDAGFFGSAPTSGGALPVVAISPSADGHGYLLLTSSPRVTAKSPGPLDKSPFRSGEYGYDVNWPQCASPSSTRTVGLPGLSAAYSVVIVGVDGWAVGSDNPCLAAEARWATGAKAAGGAPYELYVLLNSPAGTSTNDGTGPGGTCALAGGVKRDNCLAYNYGYNSAAAAFAYAKAEDAVAPVWWLDLENTSCSGSNFNGGFAAPWSCTTSFNDLTIEGAIDALRAAGVIVGIYSTSLQYGAIAGSFVPKRPQVPIWIAGAPWTTPPYPASYRYESPANLRSWCNGGASFAGGVPWVLQETPGPNGYPIDPDYAC